MRKIIIILICAFLFNCPAFCQMVTTDPAVPVSGTVIKIFYDSSKDAGDLHNYTGDIYVHTGVFLQGTSGWQKVIGAWGNNTSQPKLKYNGNYVYELDITPDLKTFYSLALTDVVTKICLVFRNAGATLQTKPDIFIDVFQAGLNVTFTLPTKASFVTERYSLVPVNVAATLSDSVSLYINNKYIKSVTGAANINYTFFNDQYGEFRVKAIAWKMPAFAVDSFFFYVRKPVITEALPTGIKDGINYTGSTSVTLVLHAPYKNYAFVTGDFTNWLTRESGYMKRTPDNERYWTTVTGLTPGKEYRFQYLVDTTLYIPDPYADKILDPDNDPYITSATYPNLIKYPKDTASGLVSVLQTSQVPYAWKTTNYQAPPKSNLIIYELLVRDFTAKHDYKTLIDTLSYLDDLGVNAIELMPITEFEGNLSWGYNVSFYFAPDKYYGPKNDLKAFIDSCHNRGIAVIMDIVLNHSFGQSPFVQLYLDRFGTDQIYMKLPNPWFNAQSPNPVYKWGADFNHANIATQQLVDSVTSYWLTQYKIDGFRFDFTKGFTNTAGEGSSYDASRISLLKRMANHVWSVNPNGYVILEHFAANSEEKELSDYGMMLWGNNNSSYSQAAQGLSSDLTGASSLSRGWSSPSLVSYMESHDEERIMYNTIAYGASSGSYNTQVLKTALKRMQLDAVFFLTIPGPKMIWQFGELGYDYSINYNGRVGDKPIKWDYYLDADRKRTFTIYKLLNNLKVTQPVFSTSTYTYSLSTPQKSIQLIHSSMKANILGNFGLVLSTITPAFPQTGKWYEYFTGDSINVVNVNDQMLLQPGEYRIYTTIKLPNPNLIVGLNDIASKKNEQFAYAYPNPSSGDFNFKIESTYPAAVSVAIYDLIGKLIKILKTDLTGSGYQSLIWDGRYEDGSSVKPGIYIARISDGFRRETFKLIKK
jgi:glycosidase